MALRSGLETEATWALNALNVMLYDDYAPPTILNHTPGLLNVLVEHFRALLSLLYPKVFEVVIFAPENMAKICFLVVVIKLTDLTIANLLISEQSLSTLIYQET